MTNGASCRRISDEDINAIAALRCYHVIVPDESWIIKQLGLRTLQILPDFGTALRSRIPPIYDSRTNPTLIA